MVRRDVQLGRARMEQVQATASFSTHSLIASHFGNSGIRLASQAKFSAMDSTHLEPKVIAVK